ncbi:putative G2-specific protein kinase nim-1 [Blattamonas nauphoetae]|uniref:non-specific serine/threonine protein kinase n=1 Tax=Blattamonas nauphoetae TaxID=2049346 RepID=A0ABQ9XW38_9EUKA|nr:putative G2-specific protein kinase nim-1 [Blattamonas nauphoetae]
MITEQSSENTVSDTQSRVSDHSQAVESLQTLLSTTSIPEHLRSGLEAAILLLHQTPPPSESLLAIRPGPSVPEASYSQSSLFQSTSTYRTKLKSRKLAKERRNKKARNIFEKLFALPVIESQSSLEEAFFMNEQRRSGILQVPRPDSGIKPVHPVSSSDKDSSSDIAGLPSNILGNEPLQDLTTPLQENSSSHLLHPLSTSSLGSSNRTSSSTSSSLSPSTVEPIAQRPSTLPPTPARGLYQATPTPLAASTGQMAVLQQSFYLPHSQPFPTTPSIKTRSNSFINRPLRQSSPITNMVDDKPSNIRPIHPNLQIPPLPTISPRQQDSEAALDQLDSVRSGRSALSNSSHGLSYSPTQTSDFVSSTLSRMSYHSFSGSESPTSFFSSFGTSPHSSLMSSSSLPSSTNEDHRTMTEDDKTPSCSSLAPFTPPPQTVKLPPASRLIIPSQNLNAPRLHHTQEQHSRSLEDGVGHELFQALSDGTLSPIGADWMQLDTDNSLHIAQVLQYLAVRDSINGRNDSFSLSNEEDTPPTSDKAKKQPGNVPLPVPIHPSQFIREPNSSNSSKTQSRGIAIPASSATDSPRFVSLDSTSNSGNSQESWASTHSTFPFSTIDPAAALTPLIANGTVPMSEILAMVPPDVTHTLVASAALQPDNIPPTPLAGEIKSGRDQHTQCLPTARLINQHWTDKFYRRTVTRSLRSMNRFRSDFTESVSSNDSSTVSDLSHAVFSWKEDESNSLRQIGGSDDIWKETETAFHFLRQFSISPRQVSINQKTPEQKTSHTRPAARPPFISVPYPHLSPSHQKQSGNAVPFNSAQTLPARLHPSTLSAATVITPASHPPRLFFPHTDSRKDMDIHEVSQIFNQSMTSTSLQPHTAHLNFRGQLGQNDGYHHQMNFSPIQQMLTSESGEITSSPSVAATHFSPTQGLHLRTTSSSTEMSQVSMHSSSTTHSKESLNHRAALPPLSAKGRRKLEGDLPLDSPFRSQSLTQLASLPPHPQHSRAVVGEQKQVEEKKEKKVPELSLVSEPLVQKETVELETDPIIKTTPQTPSSSNSTPPFSSTHTPFVPPPTATPDSSLEFSNSSQDQTVHVNTQPTSPIPSPTFRSISPQLATISARSTDVSLASEYSHLSTTSLETGHVFPDDHSEFQSQSLAPLSHEPTDSSSVIKYESEQEMLRRKALGMPQLSPSSLIESLPNMTPITRNVRDRANTVAVPVAVSPEQRLRTRMRPIPHHLTSQSTSIGSQSSTSLTYSSTSGMTPSSSISFSQHGNNGAAGDWAATHALSKLSNARKRMSHTMTNLSPLRHAQSEIAKTAAANRLLHDNHSTTTSPDSPNGRRNTMAMTPAMTEFMSRPDPLSIDDSLLVSQQSMEYLSSISSHSASQSQLGEESSPVLVSTRPPSICSEEPKVPPITPVNPHVLSMSQPQLQTLQHQDIHLHRRLHDPFLTSLTIDEDGQSEWGDFAGHDEMSEVVDLNLHETQPHQPQADPQTNSKQSFSACDSKFHLSNSSGGLQSLHTLHNSDSQIKPAPSDSASTISPISAQPSRPPPQLNSPPHQQRMHKSTSGSLPARVPPHSPIVSRPALVTSNTMPFLVGINAEAKDSQPTNPDETTLPSPPPSSPRHRRHRRERSVKTENHRHRSRRHDVEGHEKLTRQHRSQTQKNLPPETRHSHRHRRKTSPGPTLKSTPHSDRSESVDYHLLKYLMDSLVTETDELSEMSDLSEGERREMEELIVLQRMDAYLLLRIERERRVLLAKRHSNARRKKDGSHHVRTPQDTPSHPRHTPRSPSSPEQSILSQLTGLPSHDPTIFYGEGPGALEMTRSETACVDIPAQIMQLPEHVSTRLEMASKKKRKKKENVEEAVDDGTMLQNVLEELLKYTRRYKQKNLEKEKEKQRSKISRARSKHKLRSRHRTDSSHHDPSRQNESTIHTGNASPLRNDTHTSVAERGDENTYNSSSQNPKPAARRDRSHKASRETDTSLERVMNGDVSSEAEEELNGGCLLGFLYYNTFNDLVSIKPHSFLFALVAMKLGEFIVQGTIARTPKGSVPFSEESIWSIMVQLSGALAFVHDHKIIHRDIKSQNIFMFDDEIVKLGDFGVSVQLQADDLMKHSLYGTPLYLSPEMCENKPYTSYTDIWSLGIVLHELCTFQVPFDGRSLAEVMRKMSQSKIAPDIPSRYSASLSLLHRSMLNKIPDKRPSASDINLICRRVLGDAGIPIPEYFLRVMSTISQPVFQVGCYQPNPGPKVEQSPEIDPPSPKPVFSPQQSSEPDVIVAVSTEKHEESPITTVTAGQPILIRPQTAPNVEPRQRKAVRMIKQSSAADSDNIGHPIAQPKLSPPQNTVIHQNLSNTISTSSLPPAQPKKTPQFNPFQPPLPTRFNASHTVIDDFGRTIVSVQKRRRLPSPQDLQENGVRQAPVKQSDIRPLIRPSQFDQSNYPDWVQVQRVRRKPT